MGTTIGTCHCVNGHIKQEETIQEPAVHDHQARECKRFDDESQSGGFPGEQTCEGSSSGGGSSSAGEISSSSGFLEEAGVRVLSSGKRYEGQLKRGRFHGQGLLTSPDGSFYRGSFAKGVRCGDGVFESMDGDRYDGAWSDDLCHGVGTATFANGDCYKGSWCRGQMHGFGVYTYANGSRFEGVWRWNRHDEHCAFFNASGENIQPHESHMSDHLQCF